MERQPEHEISYDDYTQGTMDILVESQNETEPYTVEVRGMEYVVLPNVFSPKYFNDTEIFAQHIPITKGEKVLEIGPGTGAISITAAYKGAGSVVAIDINPDAVKNTEINIQLHEMDDRVEVREGDLYDAVKEDEKFDKIFWNTPFALVEDENVKPLEKAVLDPGYKATERFIKEAREHLNPKGVVIIGFSTTLGRLDLLEKFTAEAGLSLKLLHEAESEEVNPVKFELFEARPL